MDHPLAMEVEAMRRAGYAAVDALAARLADPQAIPYFTTWQVLQLTSDDFQWLVRTQPTVRAELAKIFADRLRRR